MDQIFNATSDLVLYVDNTRTILECNDSSLDLLGYERDEVRGQSVTMLYTNDLLMERYFEEMAGAGLTAEDQAWIKGRSASKWLNLEDD